MKTLRNQSIILASEAVWRSQILSQLGIPHQCVAHQYDESLKIEGTVQHIVQGTSRGKAFSILSQFPDSMILSADQLIEIDNQILGKPGDFEKAKQQLMLLNGREHRLHCALTVLYRGNVYEAVEEARLTMRPLMVEEIERYLHADTPFGCAGSYKIESLGASLFEKIEVADWNTIIGIPGIRLLSILRDLGFSNLL